MSRKYLFPRGLREGPPPGTSQWDKGELHWVYFPEAAMHRFIVRMHERGEVVCDEGSDGHWRDAVLIEHPAGTRAAIVAKIDDGILEVRFDPASPPDQRMETWRFVKDLFASEFIGVLPRNEIPPSAGPKVNRLQNTELSTERDLAEQDRPRIQRVEAWLEQSLGSLGEQDRMLVRELFRKTRLHPFGGNTGRISFRAAYFFWEILIPASKLHVESYRHLNHTWDEILDWLGRKLPQSQEVGWDSFGESTHGTRSSEALRKSLERRNVQSLLASLDAINPYKSPGGRTVRRKSKRGSINRTSDMSGEETDIEEFL